MNEIDEYNSELDLVEQSKNEIAHLSKIDELLEYNRKSMALHDYAKAARMPIEAWNYYIAKAAYGRRKIGQMLVDPRFERAGVGRPENTNNLLVLKKFGIEYMESSRWQQLANIQDNKWDDYFYETKIITFTGLYNLAKIEMEIDTPEGQYNVIVLDPPWPGRKIKRIVRPNQEREYDYPELTMGDIQNIKLPMAENSHIFLWITNKLLPEGFLLFNLWKVKYICMFVWHKPGGYQPQGLPQYNCEFVLYGRIGKPIFIDTKQFNLCFEAPRGRHSEKPDYFFEMIARTTNGKRTSLFERKKRKGFEGWGNEYPQE